MRTKYEGQMTVEALIKELQQCPQDALVYTEGCDCEGGASDVEIDESDNSILIGRF